MYPQGSAMTPAAGPPPDEAHARAPTRGIHAQERPMPPRRSRFRPRRRETKLDDPDARPPPLASLYGSLALSVIDGFTLRIHARPPRFCARLPASRIECGNDQRYAHRLQQPLPERTLRAAQRLVAHEIPHPSAVSTTWPEQIILNTLNTLVHTQHPGRDPALALIRHRAQPVPERLAADAAQFTHAGSGRHRDPRSQGRGTVPGSAKSQPDLWSHAVDFWASHRAADAQSSTSAHAALGAALHNVLAAGVALPTPLTFSKQTRIGSRPVIDHWLPAVGAASGSSVVLGIITP